jgi:signal transduction histidine kinase/ligand-binding sensor domain-containing protein/DNA-binding response OmpR family regulator
MGRLNIFLFLLSVLICFGLHAQPLQYRFSRIDANNGVSHNQIKTFYRDSHGFMWFGTVSGLNRFDGYSIKVFRNNSRDTTSIINDDINRIFEDPDGRIWISTWTGLDVYDPYTDRFGFNAGEMLDKYGLPDNKLTDIVKDKKGNYWFIHQNRGIYFHNVQQHKTHNLNYVDVNIYTLASNSITCLQPTAEDDVWIMHRNGVLELVDPNTLKVKSRDSVLYKEFKGSPNDYRFIVDSDEDLWIYMSDSNNGIFHLDTSTGKLSPYNQGTQPIRLNADIVRGVVEDNNKLIWIATDHGGINVIDKKKKSVEYILNSPENPYSLSQNSINTLYKDREGVIWAGTFKSGVNFYHENIIRFPLYRHAASESSSLPFDDVNSFAEDEKGNLWIGTNGGGLIYFNRQNNTFKQYLHDPQDANSLSTNVIVSLYFDHNKRLWIGTFFGGMDCFDGKNFLHYRNIPGDGSSVSDNSIWEIFEDSKNRLYVGTLSYGVNVFDTERKKIAHYSPYVPNTIHGDYVTSFMEDKEGSLWIGTGYGVEVLDRERKKFTHYITQPNNPSSLSNNSILCIMEDSRGFVWIGTHGGLNLFDKAKKTFRSFTTADGLPHNSILTIVEDDNKNLWLGTPDGISNMKIRSISNFLDYEFSNYDQFDGLQGKQYNENAVLKTHTGEIIFGGANGFNIFDPDDIPLNEIISPVVLTDLQILNQPITTGTKFDDRIILDRAIAFTRKLELKHKDNVFSLEFAALSVNHPEKIQYKYKLEGFDENWISTTSAQRKVTYTNLDPGEYTFRVIASNNDGIWNEKGAELQITILPPLWRTRSAMVVYIFLIAAALFFTRKLVQQRERMKFAIEQERQEAQRMHELDMMKIKFFTNISHEFRTPLTLILTPIERILKRPEEQVQPAQLDLIYRNAKRLLNLVNQLLDFRKLEVQEIKFNPSEGDIIKFIKETVFTFSDLSEKKGIALRFHSPIGRLETIFDLDKLEKILFNLLSNSFKFTPEGGEVNVEVTVPVLNKLQIKVCDTGIGIPQNKKDKIFERFFQNELPKSMVNQGSGIGLSITKEFVKVHDGTITVESEPGKGSSFIVTLPIKDLGEIESPRLRHSSLTKQVNGQNNDRLTYGKLPSLLLVEDNEDFRFYLKDNLRSNYHIIEATDGKDGWDKVLANLPDLVVSDIMMPEMNGLDLCRKIKNDQRVSHTPVILLTARTSEEQKLEGFETGAEDYITKPFNFEILQSRIKNLIHQRELFQRDFRQLINVKASHLQITSLDEKLIQKALEVVERKLSDSDFTVEELARELSMSRVHLYKKLQALTGKSPLEFIRTLRLQHAAQLLEKSQLTVSEVAYKVGFNNPKYFARYFKDEYQVLPSLYAATKRNDTD